MDPVSNVANIVAIIHATNRLIALCRRFFEVMRDAPGELRLILVEVSTLKAILDDLHFLVSCNQAPASLDTLTREHGPIEGCQKVVSELEDLLPPECLLSTESKKKVLAALRWLMKESKAKTLLDELKQYKTTIALALTTDSSIDIKEIKGNTEKIYAALTDAQEQNVYNWLYATDPSDLHERACNVYEPGTGEWLFRSPEWESWLKEKTRCLWVHGIPGAGKTIFASHLIESVRDHCYSRGSEYACVYYYCYFGHSQDETVPFLRWVLLELCRQLDRVPLAVHELYRRGGKPNSRNLLLTLEKVVQSFDRVFIFVDAVDESLQRENLLRVLRELAGDPRFKNLRLLATSREYMDIEEVMSDISTPISMRNYLADRDIALYIQSRLNNHPRLKRWPKQIREDVLESLSMKANGMFRWVVCQIDTLQLLRPETRIIEAALANLPRTLDETYEGVFQRIPEEARLFVQHVFHWMSTHRAIHQAIPSVQRTLSVSLTPLDIPTGLDIPCDLLFRVVQESLASENSDDSMFLSGYILDEELLRELCGCLITVTNYPVTGPDSTSIDMPVVSFAHYTVLEFLESSRIRGSLAAPFALDRNRVVTEHATILLRGAAASADRWDSELPQYPGPDVFSDFDRYCAHSAVLLLRWQPQILISPEETTLLDPVIRLLETRVPYMGSYFWYDALTLCHLENPIAPAIGVFRLNHTIRILSPPAPHFEKLLRMLQMDPRGYLPQTFLATLGRTSEDLAYKLDLEFQPNVFYKGATSTISPEEYDVRRSKVLRFRGSILEFFAQLPPDLNPQVQNEQGLCDLLDFAAGHFDPSTLLLFAVPNHKQPSWNDSDPGTTNWGYRLLQKLLRLGAKSTVPGFAVGALQLAVALRDSVVVHLLLDAGVDPNDIGDLSGDIGTPETGPMLEWFQCIRGRSPLNIAVGLHYAYRLDTKLRLGAEKYSPVAPGHLVGLAKALVEYGAKDFVVPLVEDLPIATKMEKVMIAENERSVA